ncbi:MAG: dTDP-4-dehydrorhamnose 3,5-epimerase family protein, partial [Candidatus Omnitrophica bacterium]|nr:dTDP-4-dehydrorhamnose 3,5-epimerase family protein [Candidatus Omnitrophota bacterium]
MIDGVKVKKLKIIPDDRGMLMEILRCDDEIFKSFGQVYMTTAKPGVVKAWHYHKIQDDNFACVHGKIRLVLYDARIRSATYKEINEFILSLEEPILVHIPKLVYHGFKGISECEAIVINTPTKPYSHKDPDEFRL